MQRNNIKYAALWCCLVFYMFNVKYKYLPPSQYIAAGIFCVLFTLNSLKHIRLSADQIYLVLACWAFIFASLLSLIFAPNPELTFTVGLLLAIFFSVSVVPLAITGTARGEVQIFKFFGLVGLLNAVFILLMIVSSSFYSFYHSLLADFPLKGRVGEASQYLGLYRLRMVGLSGSATYGVAVTQIALAFCYVTYLAKCEGSGRKLLHVIGACVVAVSALFAGRTALVGYIFLFIYCWYIFGWKTVFFATFLTLISFLCVVFVVSLFLPQEVYDFFYNWLIEPFTQGIETSSLQTNIDMYEYSLAHFESFGQFRFRNESGGYLGGSDVGFYRILFAFGYFGLSFFLLLLLLFVVKFTLALKNKKCVFSCGGLLLTIFIVVVHFKGNILFDVFSLFTVLVVYFVSSEKSKRQCNVKL